ncbi:hypothetical protein IE81DRAFT_367739 [Ceraceosorus guamensis]|uniref:STE3-domain-containing protein n=1 Tax=Ceraceosorus guamensis TaxID=1522189 RepID=A0A316VVW8_9BASI|nr:hypothetical protein IE81DRAFT_367739 [Ceraceosorus guamensis]PWN41088.1 hypothetical protein IE81DRAFT_367739 [Ceraceosorus guamensis]
MSANYAPPGLAYSAQVGRQMTVITINFAFSGMAAPLVALLLWSARRRHFKLATYWVALLCALLLFVASFLNGPDMYWGPVYHRPIPLAFDVVIGAINFLLPWLADLNVTLRLLIFYPLKRTSFRTLAAVFGLPLAIKLARFAMIVWYINLYTEVERGAHHGDREAQAKLANVPGPVYAEFALQILDNLWGSGILIYRLRSFLFNHYSVVGEASTVGGANRHRFLTIQSKLKNALHVAVLSCILPVGSCIALAVTSAQKNFDALNSVDAVHYGICTVNILIAQLLPMLYHPEHSSFDPQTRFIKTKNLSTSPGSSRSGRTPQADEADMHVLTTLDPVEELDLPSQTRQEDLELQQSRDTAPSLRKNSEHSHKSLLGTMQYGQTFNKSNLSESSFPRHPAAAHGTSSSTQL